MQGAVSDACSAAVMASLTCSDWRPLRPDAQQVCMDEEVSMALQPCGHVCVCEECAGPLKNCPMCRSDISRSLHVYLS